jgi:hypothetical protein
VTARHPLTHLAAGPSRRTFLAACAGLAAVAGMRELHALVPGALATARFLAARRNGARHEVVLIDGDARELAALALPERGHSFAIDGAGNRAVIFGRQPGFYALAFALPDCRLEGALPLPADRHFFGHGVFSADGTLLYATENDFEEGRGVLGIYDARPGARWARMGEFATGGVGPHEVVLMPDGRTLCVANGGLLTHPDYGKTPLNLSTMRPSLVYLDASNGQLLDQVILPPELFQLSIRHLAVDGSGAVWFACQHEGPATQRPPLLGRHRRGGAPELFAGPPAVLHGLRNYLGSIAIDAARGLIATSSPVGGQVAFWSAMNGACVGNVALADGCGVALHDDERFLISSGFGAIIAAGPRGGTRELAAANAELAWDNHLRRV